ncbi:MAG: BtrH N-terminal domain-containing protein, partial [Candidatus Hodarchaeales archaeon]
MSDTQENKTFHGVIEGFRHEPGVHCTSSAVRDVFEFHGWKMSEAMIFGLGSGMTLAYLKIPKMQPFFGGRNRDIVKDLCSSLSVSMTDYKSKKEIEGWERLKRHLDNMIPSVIDIDMGFLNYQKATLHSEDFHFGGHTIAVCGYDSDRKIVLVADTHFVELQEVSYDELVKGRNSTIDRFMAPNNRIFEFDFPMNIPKLATVIEGVLRRTGDYLLKKSNRMARIIGIHSGTKSINVLINDLDRWYKLPDEKLKARCIQQAGYIGT